MVPYSPIKSLEYYIIYKNRFFRLRPNMTKGPGDEVAMVAYRGENPTFSDDKGINKHINNNSSGNIR